MDFLSYDVEYNELSPNFLRVALNQTCDDYTSCSSCISSSTISCTWCSDSSTCGDSETTHCSQSQLSTCNETMYAIVIIVVVVCMICVCCCGCYIKRRINRNLEQNNPNSSLLSSTARAFLFRNSMTDGQKEWMCVICGFDNHPRSKHCSMCGTSHEFSIDYKKEKSERRKILKERLREAYAKRKKSKGEKKPIIRNPIQYPSDAQISSHDVMSLSISTHTTPTKIPIISQTLLSPEQKNQAFNYRRLNQLTLRQKSARRRKMWQRKYDPKSHELKWMRVQVSDIRINDAPFGYTPRNSMSDSMRYSLGVTSIHDNSINRSSTTSNVLISDPSRILLEAAASGVADDTSSNHSNQTSNVVVPGIIGFGSPAISTAKMPSSMIDHQRSLYKGRSREPSDDSFGDRALYSSSPGFTSVLDGDGNLNWERVDPHRQTPAKKPPRAPTTISSLQPSWRRLFPAGSHADDHNNNITAPLLPSGASSSTTTISGERVDSEITIPPSIAMNDEREAMMHDLETIASLTFKEKQLWFLDRMSELQRPLADGWVRLNIKRDHLLEDSIASMNAIPTNDLHKWMRVQFIGEPGIDAGGLEREWFELVTKELFSQPRGLFLSSSGDASGGTYHINPMSSILINNSASVTSTSTSMKRSNSIAKINNHLDYYKFAGRLIGKAMMEQQPLPATLSLPLRKQILTTPITFSDLEFVDMDLYRNLLYLQNDCDDVAALDMDFTVTYRNIGKTLQCNLVDDGENIAVTNANRDIYLQLRLRHRMFDSIKMQLEAMLKGIYEVIPPDLLSVFDYQELDLLLCGIPDINVEDWKSHTEYMGEYGRYGAKHKVIKWFWKAVDDMSSEERVRLLQFVTGCGRLPVQGFKALQSSDGKYRRFNIQSIVKRDSLYPRAHTCFNKLDLPMYDTSAELDAYLSIVINMEITGFTME